MGNSTTLNVFFLLFGALQGLLLAFLIWQKKRDLANAILAGLILLATAQIFHKVVSKIWLMENLTGAYKVGYELPFLFGPLLYGYITASLNPSFKLNWKHLLHLSPFIWYAALRLLYIYVFPYNDLIFWLLPFTTPRTIIQGGLQILSLWVYGIMVINVLKNNGEHAFSHWLKQFTLAILGIETILIIVLKLMVIYYGQYPDLRLAFLSLTLLIYWLTYQVMHRSLHEPDKAVELTNESVSKKYANSGLKAEASSKIIISLEQMLKKEQLYLQPDLKIEILAEKLDVSKHHLSQAINTEKGFSYHDLINTYRIKAAQAILDDPKQSHLTIAAIAFDTGFQSISNFNSVFKRVALQTPSHYRKFSREILPDRSDR